MEGQNYVNINNYKGRLYLAVKKKQQKSFIVQCWLMVLILDKWLLADSTGGFPYRKPL